MYNKVVFNNTKIKFLTGKNFLTGLSFDKVFLGNFMQKIYQLKKANCYKSRGFLF
jgi:hypothetical protein